MGLFGKKYTIGDVQVRLPIEELRKRARILVIDDDENSFPLSLLKAEGYAIDYWPKVKNLNELERGQFDIIILDIGGVANEWGESDGLGILEHIKEVNPTQVVVAFSGMTFDLSKNRFWRMADDSLCKPVDAAKCKRLIDNLLKSKLTVQHYWKGIETLLKGQGTPQRQISKIEDQVSRALMKKDSARIETALRSILAKAEIAEKIMSLGLKLVSLIGV